jgi:hypothetical protein
MFYAYALLMSFMCFLMLHSHIRRLPSATTRKATVAVYVAATAALGAAAVNVHTQHLTPAERKLVAIYVKKGSSDGSK